MLVGLSSLGTSPAEARESAGDRELRELHPGHEGEDAEEDEEKDDDPHMLWASEGRWWTDYPPPAGFDGQEEGEYRARDYRRTLSPEEQAVIDADLAVAAADIRERGEAQRAAFFGQAGRPGGASAPPPAKEEEEPGCGSGSC